MTTMRIDEATRSMSKLLGVFGHQAEPALGNGSAAPGLSGCIHFHRSEGRHGGSFFVARPATEPDIEQVLVVAHGISRDAREQVELFGRVALNRGWTVIAPLFDKATHPRFQQLGIGRRESRARADLALIDFLDKLDGGKASRVCLFGYSGGAQFAHRFALFHPERVAALALGAAGWYTFPKARQPYPRGLDLPATGANPVPRLDEMLALPCAVYVGASDTLRDESLNTSPKIDRDQGEDRVERARRWVAAMRDAGAARNVAVDCSLELLEGCGHSFGECADRGGLVDRVFDFFARTNGYDAM